MIFNIGSVDNTKKEMPVVTYSGSWSGLIDEGIVNGVQNWRARFYTSGELTFTDLGNAKKGIDIFCCGGGGGAKAANYNLGFGGGGGGGKTTTKKGVSVALNTKYAVVVGAGGSGANNEHNTKATAGGTSSISALGVSAAGGGAGHHAGGSGGSGGAGGHNTSADYGGTDGSDGKSDVTNSTYYGGKGQGTTTREFGDPSGRLYSGGGSGHSYTGGAVAPIDETAGGLGRVNGVTNRGGGGGCGAGYDEYGNGGSGIVVIRNAR